MPHCADQHTMLTGYWGAMCVTQSLHVPQLGVQAVLLSVRSVQMHGVGLEVAAMTAQHVTVSCCIQGPNDCVATTLTAALLQRPVPIQPYANVPSRPGIDAASGNVWCVGCNNCCLHPQVGDFLVQNMS